MGIKIALMTLGCSHKPLGAAHKSRPKTTKRTQFAVKTLMDKDFLKPKRTISGRHLGR